MKMSYTTSHFVGDGTFKSPGIDEWLRAFFPLDGFCVEIRFDAAIDGLHHVLGYNLSQLREALLYGRYISSAWGVRG